MKSLILSLLLSISLHAAGPVRCAFDAQVVDWNKRCLTNHASGQPNLAPNLTRSLIASSVFMGVIRGAGLYPGNILRANLFCGSSWGGTNGAGDCVSTPTVECYEIGSPQLPLIVDAGSSRDTISAVMGFWKYQETGTGGGLGPVSISNPAFMDTGLLPSSVSSWINDIHAAVYMMGGTSAFFPFGVTDNSNYLELTTAYTGLGQISRFGSVTGYPLAADTNGAGFYLGTRTSSASTGINQYKNGVSTGTSTSVGGSLSIAFSIYVFALNQAGSGLAPTPGLMGGYIIGRGLNGTQQLAEYNAMQQAQTLLQRQK